MSDALSLLLAASALHSAARSRSWGSRRSYGESLAQARARRSRERDARRAKKARRRAVQAARRIQRSHQ